ncbi:MAG: manganese-binding transcriptional regulator MntR [Opitutales bacterium]
MSSKKASCKKTNSSPKSLESSAASRTAAAQAKSMGTTRKQHAIETAQDYVEAISDLQAQRGEARVVDLAAQLGVSHATVIQTVKRLQRNGLVTSEPYRSIFLTDIGRGMAKEAKHRHEVTVALLKKLGVGDEAAEADAEGMEHHVSKETLKAFERFIGE